MSLAEKAFAAFWGDDRVPWADIPQVTRNRWEQVVAHVHAALDEGGALARKGDTDPGPQFASWAISCTLRGLPVVVTVMARSFDEALAAIGLPSLGDPHAGPPPPPKLTEVERLTKERDEARALLEKAVDTLGEYVDADLHGIGRPYFHAMRELFASWKTKPSP